MKVFERAATTVLSSRTAGAPRQATIRADEEGLSLDGRVVARPEEIASVSFGLGERVTVRVRTTGAESYSIPFTQRDEAVRLIAALGRDPEQTVVDVGLELSLFSAGIGPRSWWKPAAIGRSLGLLAFAGVSIAAPAAALLLSAVVPASDRRRFGNLAEHAAAHPLERRLEIGSDGLRLRSIAADELLPITDIAAVEARGDALLLRLREGAEIALPVAEPACLPEVVTRIGRLVGEPSAPADRVAIDTLIAMDGTSPEAVAALQQLGQDRGPSYRDVQLSREHLLGVVEDPRSDARIRARAAVALSSGLSDAERQRLRVVADATVSPHLRVALEALVTHLAGDASVLSEALEASAR